MVLSWKLTPWTLISPRPGTLGKSRSARSLNEPPAVSREHRCLQRFRCAMALLLALHSYPESARSRLARREQTETLSAESGRLFDESPQWTLCFRKALLPLMRRIV